MLLSTLQWRHNERDGVSNHQHHDCLLNGLFRRRSKKTSRLRVTGLCAGNSHRWPVYSPHKWPVTRKMYHFDDVQGRGLRQFDCSRPVKTQSCHDANFVVSADCPDAAEIVVMTTIGFQWVVRWNHDKNISLHYLERGNFHWGFCLVLISSQEQ